MRKMSFIEIVKNVYLFKDCVNVYVIRDENKAVLIDFGSGNVYDHLSLSGVLFLSVPNGPRDKGKTDNPHHLHHFTVADLKALIQNYFSNAEFFSQAYKKDFKHYGTKFLRKIKLLKKQPYFVNNYFLNPGLCENIKTWVVIAHK